MSTIQSQNPATGEILNKYETLDQATISQKIELAHEAYKTWRTSNWQTRKKLLQNVAEILKNKRESLAKIMTQEMGKRFVDGLAEIDKCALVCTYYSEQAESQLKDEIITTEAKKSYVSFEPLGVVFAIMPWNFPFWQVFRAAAPAIMAGNSMLLKHASNVPACALAIEQIFLEAGATPHLFQTLLIKASDSAIVVSHPSVRLVSLTGSEEAGMQVASLAGSHIKRTVLELGGSDPFIVLEDADVEQAAKTAASARMIVSGQSCIAAKRFIIHEKIHDKFVDLFKSHLESLKMGDPMLETTSVAPLSSSSIRETLHKQVTTSITQGATLVTGGKIPDGPGYFYPPTLLTDVTPSMSVAIEETFGPVAAVIKIKSHDEAIAVANDSHFGLGASVWTTSESAITRFAQAIESGSVFINSMVKSDPRLPFGGIKFSGYGRELSSYGIKEFVNIKTVWIN